MKAITEMMSAAGILGDKQKRECEKLIGEQEKLEEEAESELLVKILNYSDSSSGDIYGDGDQSPLKG